MLTADRPEMAVRAIRSFAKQTNRRSVLFVVDSGRKPLFEWCSTPGARRWGYAAAGRVICAEYHPGFAGRPVFDLMNRITDMADNVFGAATNKVFVKWDDDDYSHRDRIENQLGLLAFDPERRVVGYNSMPLAVHVVCNLCKGDPINRTICSPCKGRGFYCSQVVEYLNPSSNYALGTSLMYTREAWEGYHFPDTTSRKRRQVDGTLAGNIRGTGSDTAFVHHWAAAGRLHGINSKRTDAQMMVASVHSKNASMVALDPSWNRAGEAREREIRVLMEETE